MTVVGWVLLVGYALCLLLLLPRLPLLLDEILDTLTVHAASWRELIEAIPRNSGAAPLSYLARWGAIGVFGESSFSARLPSAIFSLCACPGVYLLGRRWGLRWPLLAVVLFVLSPLPFRYALEARAYSQALCLSIWATVLFFELIEHPAARLRALSYAFCIVAGLYTQPFTIFVPLAHLTWLYLSANPEDARIRKMRTLAALIIVSAIVAFIPWYIYGSRIWGHQVATSGISGRSGLLIAHEISGSGYSGTAILLCGIVFGVRSQVDRRMRGFWLFYLMIPVIGAIAADIAFTYFLAIRQMIFVLPPVAVLCAAGVEYLFTRKAIFGILLFAAVIGASLYGDIHLFRRAREDWHAAASILIQQRGGRNCIFFEPEHSVVLYTYFYPELASKECKGRDLTTLDSVAIAVSPYSDESTKKTLVTRQLQLRDSKWVNVATLNGIGPRVELYRRAQAIQSDH